jgi:hypothetical protein
MELLATLFATVPAVVAITMIQKSLSPRRNRVSRHDFEGIARAHANDDKVDHETMLKEMAHHTNQALHELVRISELSKHRSGCVEELRVLNRIQYEPTSIDSDTPRAG